MHDIPLCTSANGVRTLAMLVLALAVSACGYHQEVPTLPGGARRLAIGSINNNTHTGELDTRLRERLQRHLARQSFMRLVPAEESDEVLSVELNALRIDRAWDGTGPGYKVLTFTLTGKIRLVDRRNGRLWINGEAIQASDQVVVTATVLETPAVRDDGIDRVLNAFVEQVSHRLFLTF